MRDFSLPATYFRQAERSFLGCGREPLTVPFYTACGFRELRREPGYFPAHYDHPIWEAGKLLTDLVVFALDLAPPRSPGPGA